MRQMKDSGIEWIGQIPQEWNVIRVKHLATQKGSLFLDGDWINSDVITTEGIRYLTSGNVGEGFYKEQGNGHIDEETFRKLNCLKAFPEDLMISRLNEPVGRCCIVPDTHPYYVVAVDNVILRPDDGYNKKFILYCMNTQGYAHAALMAASGTTMVRISRTSLGNLSIPIAFAEEQERIVAYLDAKCAEIDALIEAKEKTNALLRERRQSIIYEAVTKGLNSDAPMKDSGIEWIGMIPEKFQLIRLKYLCGVFGRIGFRGYTQADLVAEGEGPITLSPSNISENGMDYSKCTYLTWDKYYESPEIQIENNDILLVKTGSSYGKSTIVENLPMEATINPQFVVMKNIKCHPKFLHYIMQTQIIKYQVEQVVVGGTIPTMAQEKINNFHIVLPSEDEICTIVDYLDGKCAEFDTLISANEATIQKLKEYRQSVIYEAVTGKVEI